jgi:hypothetical protein
VEGDVLEFEVLSVEGDATLRQELANHLQPFFENAHSLARVEAQGGELPLNSILADITGARAENCPAVR